METLKNIAVALVVSALVAAGVSSYSVKSRLNNVGALASPDLMSPYFRWGAGNGVRFYPVALPLKTASTTPCAIQSPAATSTLISAGIKLDVSSSSATTWTIAKATTAYATTTNLGTDYIVGAGKQAFIHASSTATAGLQVFAPSTFVVFSEVGGITAGDTAGTGFVPSGTCHAVFEEFTT